MFGHRSIRNCVVAVAGISACLLPFAGSSALNAQTRDGWTADADAFVAVILRSVAVLRQDRVIDLDWSPDGATLVMAGERGAWMHDVNAPDSSPRLLSAETGSLKSVAFSPNGKGVVLGGEDGRLHLLDDVEQAEALIISAHRRTVTDIAFSPDGRTIVSSSDDGTVRLWDATTGDEQGVLDGHGGSEVTSLAFNPEGKLLATGAWNGDRSIVLWNFQTRTAVRTLATQDWVWSVAFTPDGSLLVSGSESSPSVRFWDTTTGVEADLPKVDHPLATSVDVSPDGATLLLGSVGGWSLLADVATGDDLAYLEEFGSVATSAFSPNGLMLAVAVENFGVRLWTFDKATDVQRVRLEQEPWGLAFSPDGTTVGVAQAGGVVQLLDSRTGSERLSLKAHVGLVRGVSFSPDGKMLASAGADGTARLWDVATGAPGTVLLGHEGAVSDVAFDPSGSVVATASFDNTVRLWDVTTSSEIAVLRDGFGAVFSVAFSPTGNVLGFGGIADVHLQSFGASYAEPLTRRALRFNRRVLSISFNPAGDAIAAAGTMGAIQLWHQRGVDRANRPLWTDEPERMIGGATPVNDLAFSPDGSVLASISDDSTVRLWEVTSGDEVTNIQARRERNHGLRGCCIAFSPDNGLLAWSDGRGFLFLWPVPRLLKD